MLKNRIANQSGFTLVEIMVVVVIIGLLATFVIPNLIPQQDKALKTKVEGDISRLETQLELYMLDNFNYPSGSQGLQALLGGAGSTKYLQKLPNDPWGNPYQYANPGQKNPDRFDVWSFGADGAAGGEGRNADIGNWDD